MVTKVVATHLPHELAERLDEIANRLERSRRWIVSADSWNIQSVVLTGQQVAELKATAEYGAISEI